MNTTTRLPLQPLVEAAKLDDYWSPRVIGEVNDQYVKVAKLKGDLAWHAHDNEDEMFIVLSGNLRMEYVDCSIDLSAGDFHIVPKGILHNPVCEEECLVVLVESKTTQHTGAVKTPKTRSIDEQLHGG